MKVNLTKEGDALQNREAASAGNAFTSTFHGLLSAFVCMLTKGDHSGLQLL